MVVKTIKGKLGTGGYKKGESRNLEKICVYDDRVRKKILIRKSCLDYLVNEVMNPTKNRLVIGSPTTGQSLLLYMYITCI